MSIKPANARNWRVQFLKLAVLILLVASSANLFPGAPGHALATGSSADFALSIQPKSLTVDAGLTANATISVASLNGFSGRIVLQANDSSILGLNALSVTLNPSTLSLMSGQVRTSILSISPTPTQTFDFNITVTGTNGPISHAASTLARVVSFGIGPWGGASLGVYPGLTIHGGVRLFSDNGFQGNVTFTRTVSPIFPKGPVVTLNPTQVFLPSNGQAGTDLAIATASDTPSDNYTISVTATDGQFHQSTMITVEVSSKLTPDFVLWEYYTGMVAHAGTPSTLDLTMWSTYGFASTLTLSATVDPVVIDGPRISFTNPNVTLAGSGSGSSIMVVYTNQFTPAQTYSLTILARGGGLSHSLSNSLQVLGPWYTLSSQPGSVTVEQGSNTSAQIAEGSPDRFFGTISMNATVTPAQHGGISVAFSPEAFYSEGFYVGSTTMIVHANQSTSVGTYTLNVTGTSGQTVYWFTVSVTVIPPSPRGYLYYVVTYDGLPYPGGATILVSNFTDSGNVPMLVTSISFTADFGVFNETRNLPLQLEPGESRVLTLAISIPLYTAPGNHSITAIAKWEYYDPQMSQWIGAAPFVINGKLPVAQAPKPSPPANPSPLPSQGPNSNFPFPSSASAVFLIIQSMITGMSGRFWAILEIGVAGYITLVFAAVFVALRRRASGFRRNE